MSNKWHPVYGGVAMSIRKKIPSSMPYTGPHRAPIPINLAINAKWLFNNKVNGKQTHYYST